MPEPVLLEEVAGRTVRHAEQGIGADPSDPAALVLRGAQLRVGYRAAARSRVRRETVRDPSRATAPRTAPA
ncbi:hypothetical protein ACWFQ8_13115 [Streptomyces sp. NPDC055254]